jgi:hypothetical protein
MLAHAASFSDNRHGFVLDRELDLVVTNYAQFSFADQKKCEVNGLRAYCAQTSRDGLLDSKSRPRLVRTPRLHLPSL